MGILLHSFLAALCTLLSLTLTLRPTKAQPFAPGWKRSLHSWNPRLLGAQASVLFRLAEKNEVRARPQGRGNAPTRPRGQDDVVVVGEMKIVEDRLRGILRRTRRNERQVPQEIIDVGSTFVS